MVALIPVGDDPQITEHLITLVASQLPDAIVRYDRLTTITLDTARPAVERALDAASLFLAVNWPTHIWIDDC